eukprot:2228900-Prymnesium_polylepis.2
MWSPPTRRLHRRTNPPRTTARAHRAHPKCSPAESAALKQKCPRHASTAALASAPAHGQRWPATKPSFRVPCCYHRGRRLLPTACLQAVPSRLSPAPTHAIIVKPWPSTNPTGGPPSSLR